MQNGQNKNGQNVQNEERLGKTGNIAVAGITGTSTSKPTTDLNAANNAGSTSTKSSASGSGSSSSSKTGSSSKTSSSSSTKTSTTTTNINKNISAGMDGGLNGLEAEEPSYSQQFYQAFANGIPASTNVGELQDTHKAAAATRGVMENARAVLPAGKVDPVPHVDISQQKIGMRGREANEKARATQAVDYAVGQGVNELSRNLQDSKGLYQTQRNQIDADEAKALDNQMLYSEARGDKGGVGKAQYGAIQNTAASNRAMINSAEVKLQTDTTRQIEDLRAKGEFEKADKVLAISNTYLKELLDLEKWAKEKNVGIDEFNAKLKQWEQEYALDVGKYLTDTELKAAKLSGSFADGATTADYRNAVNNRYATAGKAMMSAGIVPSASQLEAMGWTPEQYWIYKMAQQSS